MAAATAAWAGEYTAVIATRCPSDRRRLASVSIGPWAGNLATTRPAPISKALRTVGLGGLDPCRLEEDRAGGESLQEPGQLLVGAAAGGGQQLRIGGDPGHPTHGLGRRGVGHHGRIEVQHRSGLLVCRDGAPAERGCAVEGSPAGALLSGGRLFGPDVVHLTVHEEEVDVSPSSQPKTCHSRGGLWRTMPASRAIRLPSSCSAGTEQTRPFPASRMCITSSAC